MHLRDSSAGSAHAYRPRSLIRNAHQARKRSLMREATSLRSRCSGCDKAHVSLQEIAGRYAEGTSCREKVRRLQRKERRGGGCRGGREGVGAARGGREWVGTSGGGREGVGTAGEGEEE